MDSKQFWQIIAECREGNAHNDNAFLKYSQEKLRTLSVSNIVKFDAYLNAYMSASCLPGIWEAAALANINGCSEDGFDYFRAWLISQGEDAYLNALKDPDTIADLNLPIPDPEHDVYGYCDLELFMYQASTAYTKVTGQEFPYMASNKLSELYRKRLANELTISDAVKVQHSSSEFTALYPHLSERCVQYGGKPEQALNWTAHIKPADWNLHF